MKNRWNWFVFVRRFSWYFGNSRDSFCRWFWYNNNVYVTGLDLYWGPSGSWECGRGCCRGRETNRNVRMAALVVDTGSLGGAMMVGVTDTPSKMYVVDRTLVDL